MSDVILDLALRTAGTPASGPDLDRHLTETCTALVGALRVTGAAIIVLDPAGVHGSDPAAVLLGEAQLGSPVGPVASALRTGRAMLTPDLTRVGPPALAAAAAECGLVCSGVTPLRALGRPVGAVQLFGVRGWAIKDSHLNHLEPLLPVLAAKLVDVAALIHSTPAQTEPAAPEPTVTQPADTDRVDTELVPTVPPASHRPSPMPRRPQPVSPAAAPPIPPPRPWSIFDTAEQEAHAARTSGANNRTH